jgi:hypothetical protein
MGFRSRLRLIVLFTVGVACLRSQIIEFESGGLKYQTLTKNGLTIMVAVLPSHVRDYAVLQIALSNGGNNTYTVRPEDFLFLDQTGREMPALPARTVVSSMVNKASRSDVIRLVTAYENGIFGNVQYKATNGYEQRRQASMAEFVSTKLKAAAAASAIAFVQTKLTPGRSTDGAVFYANAGKPLGAGMIRVRTGGLVFEFPMLSSN